MIKLGLCDRQMPQRCDWCGEWQVLNHCPACEDKMRECKHENVRIDGSVSGLTYCPQCHMPFFVRNHI